MLAKTPKPPYYAVVFSSIKENNSSDYNEMAQKMIDLAQNYKGFLGIESARDKIGITVSYWADLNAINNWKKNSEHVIAMEFGKQKWYQQYTVRICKVEKAYDFKR